MTQAAVPILMYHQFTPRPAPEFRRYTITPRRFAAQMTCLSLMGYRAVGLDAVSTMAVRAVPAVGEPKVLSMTVEAAQ